MKKFATDGSMLFSLTNDNYGLENSIDQFRDWLYENGGYDLDFEKKLQGTFYYYPIPADVSISDVRNYYGDQLEEIDTGGVECFLKKYKHTLTASEKKDISKSMCDLLLEKGDKQEELAQLTEDYKRAKKKIESYLSALDSDVTGMAQKHSRGYENRIALGYEVKDYDKRVVQVLDIQKNSRVLDTRDFKPEDDQKTIKDDFLKDKENESLPDDGKAIEDFTNRGIGDDIPV